MPARILAMPILDRRPRRQDKASGWELVTVWALLLTGSVIALYAIGWAVVQAWRLIL